ncbi:hypothetical protein A2U01_0066501, partial [Trifolium medium]|nr:hypothetical protein [Trifolium medium]
MEVQEKVENNEEESLFEGCGGAKIMEENQAPHEVELPQALPCMKRADTVDNEVVMMDVKDIEGLFSMEESFEQKRENE